MENIGNNTDSYLPVLKSEVVRHRVFDLKSEETENYEKILEECIIDPNNPIPDPEVILSYNSVPVLWRGGKSFICAVAKARKTTALTLFSAILLGKDETANGFKTLPACRVLFVDTEQAKYDSLKILNRVSRLCGKYPKEMTELMVLSLNRHGYEDIKILIETAIRNFKPDVLMLDNWTDCVSSVLDEKDCTKFSKDLRALAELYELAVFSVIHANEGEGKTDKPKFRGWAIEEERKKDELKSCLPEVLNRYFSIPTRTDKRKYMVCCPFHQEKTPSFEINTVKGLYHCFGCGKSGDVFTLVAEEESLYLEDWKDFQQVAKIIADIGGVRLSEKNTEKRTDNKMYQPNPCNLPNHSIIRPSVKVISQPPYYIPEELLQKTSSRVKETGFYQWLIMEFNQTKVDEVLALYKVGASSYKSHDGYRAVTFPMIDSKGQCVDCKIFHIDPVTGSRKSASTLYSWTDAKTGKVKSISTTFAIPDMNRKTCMACQDKLNCKDKETCPKLKRRKINPPTYKTDWPYFGEHLLKDLDSKKPIAIVESEKTAIVCSIVYPKFIWLATGSKANLSSERFLQLRNYDCTIFPDRDGLTGEGNWKDKAAQLSKSGYHIKLDTTLIYYPGEPHDDLADIIIRLKKGNGVRHSFENKNFSVPIPNRNYEEENISTKEVPLKQSLHEMYGEFIPLSWLIPEPEDKDSEGWREWLVNRTAWAYDQRENFCRNCCHAVFYAETKFRCRGKITIEEAASQKLCRGFQKK